MDFFSFDVTAYSGEISVNTGRFREFWTTGFGIYIINVLLYWLIMHVRKIKLKYNLLGILISAFVFSAVVFGIKSNFDENTVLIFDV